ncbi:putative reverse transcriptase domain-containing protein [Tanacetum coccineum]
MTSAAAAAGGQARRKREFDRLNNYPSWAKVLENAAKNDVELRNDQMRLKVEDRIRKKGRDFHKSKTGSVVAFKVTFRELFSRGISWDVWLANTSMEYNPLYDADKGFNVMPSSFHDIGDVEFQDNWGRVWVDIGTSDYFALDVLLKCLTYPVYFAFEDKDLDKVLADIKRNDAAGQHVTATTGGYKLIVSSLAPKKLSSPTITNIQGWLPGSKADGDSNQLPTIAIVASYDTFGAALALSVGSDSNGSGVVALLEIARDPTMNKEGTIEWQLADVQREAKERVREIEFFVGKLMRDARVILSDESNCVYFKVDGDKDEIVKACGYGAKSDDVRLARQINAMCDTLTEVIDERWSIIGELDMLAYKFVPGKMAEFMKEMQDKDISNLMKLQIHGKEFELRACEKDLFIQKLKLRIGVERRDGYISKLQISDMSKEVLESIEILRLMQVDDMEKASHLALMAREIQDKIMTASAIAISSDSSDESVRSLPSRVILFGDIPTIIPSTFVVAPKTSTIAPVISYAAPVVETPLLASPIGLCGLVPYSGSDSDSPDEMSSPEHISPLPAISPFLCTDSSEASDSSYGPPSQDPYVATVARWRSRVWRSRVTARPSSSSEFPIAPITAPPGIHRRRISPRSSDHRPSSSSSSSYSSPVHSSSLDAPDQAHSGSLTRYVPPRLCYPLRRASRRSEAFHRWCAAPLSTLYPSTTSELSLGDSSERPPHSSSPSAGPSRKKCRSLVNSVPSSTPVMGSLVPTRANLLPPRKRFKDSYSSEASIEEDIEIDPIETEVDMELGIGDGDDIRDHVEIDPRDVRDDTKEYEADTSAGDTVEVGIDPVSAPIVEEEIIEPAREDSSDSSGTRDGIVRSFEDMPIDLNDVVCDFYHHMFEVCIDKIVEIKTVQRWLEADQLIARGQRVSMIERIDSLRLENLKVHAMLDIKRDRVNSLCLHISLSQEEFRQVRKDYDDTRGRLRRLESTMTNTRSGMTPAAIEEMINQRVDGALEAHRVNRDLKIGNGNDNGGYGNEDGNRNGNGNGNGNGNNCGDNGDGNKNRNVNGRGDGTVARECTYQDFMKCQPLGFNGTEGVVGLIRWSEKMETVFHISNYPKRYQVVKELLKLMTEVYCPRNEIQKMETELWNLPVKNNDLATYTQRFQELTMMCTKMVPEEEDRVEKFIGGLPDNIQGNVIAAEPTRLQDDNTGGQNVARSYTAGNNKKNGYEGTFPFCNRCRAVIDTTTQGNPWPNQRVITCFKCRVQGHYRKDCPKVKNQNRGNKARVPNARGKAYVLGGGDANPGSNTVMGLLGHPFNIDMMPIDLGSFDIIIGMDWLAQNYAVIVCDEKIVRIPYGNEILIVQGDKSDKEKKSMLSIISCLKAQKYMEKGCQLFLTHVTMKENKDKSKEKRLEDVPTVRDFPEVFLEDLPGLPPI